MKLRPYHGPSDLDRCMTIWRAASEAGHPFLDAATLDADAVVVRDHYMPAAAITVAERHGIVIGFIALLGDLVGGLFVYPAAHRSGAGRALIADASRRKGRLEVEVYQANAGARAFYAACGFAVTGLRDTDDQGRRLPLIRMTLMEKEPQMTHLTALTGAEWLNPPPVWHLRAEVLTLETGERTDFWRDTLYGFRRDSGHALLVTAVGDFTAHIGFDGDYEALYDQAGLMLRQNESHWIKAGIELSDGVANLSVVVTHEASDWSTLPLGPIAGPQRLRVTRIGGAVVIQARNAANRWQLLRVTPFPEGAVQVGPMACSPERAGFRARFTEFSIGPAVAQALHDESPAT